MLAACAAWASGALLPWRADGRCGDTLIAPDGSRPARCNPWHPEGHTCCSADGWCGRSRDHCLCPTCINYQIREPWRSDGRCGEDVEGKDGTKPAQCNPLDSLNRTCCSDVGWCGGSREHCLCRECIQFVGSCSCSAERPCKDAYSGLCYPRTEAVDEWEDEGHNESALDDFRIAGSDTHDSLGHPLDPRNLAMNMDRRPELDPRGGRSMHQQMLLEKHDPAFVELARKLGGNDYRQRGRGQHHVTQQPAVLGMRCAKPLIDCVGDVPPPPALAPPTPPAPPPTNGLPSPARGGPPGPSLKKTASPSAPAGASGGDDDEDDEAKQHVVLSPTKKKKKKKDERLPVRMVNGDVSSEGRLEVLFQGRWGTICEADWDWADARVACKQLGYQSVAGTTRQAAFGEGGGPVWMSNVECTGKEESLADCSFYGLNESMVTPQCAHHRTDAGIMCSNEPMPTRAWVEEGKRAQAAKEKRRERLEQASVDATGRVSVANIEDLRSALAHLEFVFGHLEIERPIIQDKDLSRLARLRLRLNRLAGRREPPTECPPVPECNCVNHCDGNSTDANGSASNDTAKPFMRETPQQREKRIQRELDELDANLGITAQMKRQMGPELLASARAQPLRNQKSLEETKAEFEEKPYDPFEFDPVAKYLRERPEESYVPPGMEPRRLEKPDYHEPLVKRPIETRTNRKIDREILKKWMREDVERDVAEGKVGPEFLRTVGPGPWDHDEAFWSSPYDSDETYEWELQEDEYVPG